MMIVLALTTFLFLLVRVFAILLSASVLFFLFPLSLFDITQWAEYSIVPIAWSVLLIDLVLVYTGIYQRVIVRILRSMAVRHGRPVPPLEASASFQIWMPYVASLMAGLVFLIGDALIQFLFDGVTTNVVVTLLAGAVTGSILWFLRKRCIVLLKTVFAQRNKAIVR